MIKLNKHRLNVIKDYCIGWTFSVFLFAIIHRVGTVETGPVQYSLGEALIMTPLLGPFLGVLSAVFQLFFEERFYKKMSLRKLFFLRFMFSVSLFTVVLIISFWVSIVFFHIDNLSFSNFILNTNHIPTFIYAVFTDLSLSFLRQINLMLGKNTLRRLLSGEFYAPKKESRMFMFLDLKSSTSLAEKLGHLLYSSLIQDCFDDISVVMKHEANIYQYVGDEVVLTWEIEEGLKNENCLQAFYRFKKRINSRAKYYNSQYGCLPFFKASIHLGAVTVAEVGKYKKEIAYHGDTINTASRIQDMCNEFNEELLISDDVKKRLSQTSNYSFSMLGNITLKGKHETIPIFAVSEN